MASEVLRPRLLLACRDFPFCSASPPGTAQGSTCEQIGHSASTGDSIPLIHLKATLGLRKEVWLQEKRTSPW